MDYSAVSGIILQVIGGLGIFLFGMNFMSDGMQNIAGNKIRSIVGALTNNRIIAVIVGVAVTAMVQSSSVTTVMVIGFVNATLMSLQQALGVILGANIGTTITGWVLVLKIGKYGLPLAGLGAIFYLFSKRDSIRFKAMMIFGIGMVFLGLELMKKGFAPIKTMPEFREFFYLVEADSFVGIVIVALIGAMMTAIVQSSSATLGITITLASNGLITPETGIALVLGENIGTTITAFLASLGASANAKRAALAHTIVNVIGVTWVILIFHFYVNTLYSILGINPATFDPENSSTLLLASAHTGFNVTNALIFIPFLGYLSRLLKNVISDKEDKRKYHPQIDDRMLETPVIAINALKHEVTNVGKEVINMLDDYHKVVLVNKNVSEDQIKKAIEIENKIDIMQKDISEFAGKALTYDLSNELTFEAKTCINITDEYETFSDYVLTLTKLHYKLKKRNLEIEEGEANDLLELHMAVRDYLKFVNECYENNSIYKNIEELTVRKKEITQLFRSIRRKHLDSFTKKQKDVYYVTTYMDMLKIYRRLKTHVFHVIEAFTER